MAFPTVPTQANGDLAFVNQLNTTATLTGPNLNTLTKNPGDLLIAIAGEYQSTAALNAGWTGWAGGGLTWTEIADRGASGTANGRIGIAIARVVTGSETGTVTVTRSGTLTGDASMIVLCIPGAHTTTNPEVSAITSANAAAADPPALSPSWGAEDTLWIAVNGNGMTSGTGSWTANNSAPTNYTDYFGTAPADTSTVGDYGLAVAFRQLNAATEDAGAFTADTSNARNDALLIAVRPAPSSTTSVTSDLDIQYQIISKESSLAAGTGTRNHAPITVAAGESIVVATEWESGSIAGASTGVPTVAGLTFTQRGTVNIGDGTRVGMRIWVSDADATGGIRTVQMSGSTGNYASHAWVDPGPIIGFNVAQIASGQSTSYARQTPNAALYIAVGDWSAGSIAGLTWFGGAVTAQAQQHSSGTYVFGLLADSGAVGTSSQGVSAPSFTTPSIIVLEVERGTGGGTTPVSSDLDIRYAIDQQVNSDLDLRYRITQRVNSDLDLRYAIKASITSDLDLRYRITQRVNSDLDLRYAVLVLGTSQVTSDLDIRYAIRSAVSSDLDLRYRVAARVFTDFDLRYAIRAAVSSDVSLLYAIRSTVSSDVDLRYRIAQRLTSDLDVRYTLRAIINSDLDLRYGIRNTVSSDLDIRYAVASSFISIFSDLDLRYRVFGQVASSLDLRYAIRNAITSDLDVRYALRALVSSDIDVRYRIAQRLSSDLDLRYAIAQRLNSDLDVRYGITSTVNSNLDLRYIVKALVASTLDIRYAIQSTLFIVNSDLDLRYQIIGRISSDVDLRYRIRNLVNTDLDLRYGIRNTVTTDLDLRYAILSRLATDLDLRYRIAQLISSDSDLRWRVRQLASSDLDLQYKLIERIATDLNLKWRIGKGTRIKFWDGTQFVEANNIKVWNGTAWQPAIWKMWDGVDWL